MLEVVDGRDVFSHFLKMAKDSAPRIELGRSFHKQGTTISLHLCKLETKLSI